jgi:hypothetical protein
MNQAHDAEARALRAVNPLSVTLAPAELLARIALAAVAGAVTPVLGVAVWAYRESGHPTALTLAGLAGLIAVPVWIALGVLLSDDLLFKPPYRPEVHR